MTSERNDSVKILNHWDTFNQTFLLPFCKAIMLNIRRRVYYERLTACENINLSFETEYLRRTVVKSVLYLLSSPTRKVFILISSI